MKIRIALAICLASITHLAAQRANLGGRVLDPDGAPAAGWTVTAVGRTVPVAPEIGTLDRLDATTDERGRFRLRALVSVDYDVWAIGPSDDDGRVPVTSITSHIGPGALAELRATASTAPVLVQPLGIGSWRSDGPFTVRAVPRSSAYYEVPATPGDGDTFVLPPMPGERATLEVLDADGEVLARATASLRRAGSPIRAILPVSAPIEIPALVLTADGGAPVPGARIRHRVAAVWVGDAAELFPVRARLPRWRTAGVCDAEGRAVLRLPLASDPRDEPSWQLWFAAGADGFVDSHSGWQNRRPFVDGAMLEEGTKIDELRFTLQRREAPWQTSIAIPGGPAAGVRVLVEATAKIVHDSGWTHLTRRFVATTDDDGRLTIPQMPNDAYHFELAAETPAPLVEAWRTAAPRAGPFPAYLSEVGVETTAGAAPPRWELDGGHTVALQVLDRSGGPARGTRYAVIPILAGLTNIPELSLVGHADAAGRIALRLPAGPHLVVALHDDGYLTEVVEGADALVERKLQLEPYDLLRVRVDDADGPVDGATIQVVGSSMTMAGADGSAEPLIDHFFSQTNHRLLERGVTDADGVAVLQYVARQNLGYTFEARDGTRTSDQARFEARPETDLLTLEIR